MGEGHSYNTTVMKHYLFSALFLSCCLATALSAAELETIENATLIEAGLNDGDSFKVKADGKELHLRLYYVDCLETVAGTDAELERIREQQYHFGLEDPSAVVRFGEQAAQYVNGSCPGHSPFIPVTLSHRDVRPWAATTPLSKPRRA